MNAIIRLSVVVPCYNEEKNIPALVKNFGGVFAGRKDVELILVDNGSTDATGRLIGEEIARNGYGFARKVTVPNNQGYGWGILRGLESAKGELLAWTHADLQTDPADVLEAWRVYNAHAALEDRIMVKGYRVNRGWLEKCLSVCMQTVASAVLGVWLTEVNAQPKLFSRGLYGEMKDPPRDFSLDLYLLYTARKKGFEILTVPVDFRERQFGEAKGGGGPGWKNRWKLIRRTLGYVFELRKKISTPGA